MNHQAKNGRLVFCPGDVPNSIKAKLFFLKLHNNGYVFVVVASCTRDKILLAEEADYDS